MKQQKNCFNKVSFCEKIDKGVPFWGLRKLKTKTGCVEENAENYVSIDKTIEKNYVMDITKIVTN